VTDRRKCRVCCCECLWDIVAKRGRIVRRFRRIASVIILSDRPKPRLLLSFALGNPQLTNISIEWGLPVFENGYTGQQYRAIGYYTDGSSQELTEKRQWLSSDPKVFTINDTGLAKFTGKGTAELIFIYGAVVKIITFSTSLP